jgi:hypothetical protein
MEISKCRPRQRLFAAVLILGAGSLAQASDDNDGGNEAGGFVRPPSTDGVNPVYHPKYFPGYAAYRGNAGQAYLGNAGQAYLGNAGEAYGYAGSPKIRTPRVTYEEIQDE